MFCSTCGARNEDRSSFCTQCGKPLRGTDQPPAAAQPAVPAAPQAAAIPSPPQPPAHGPVVIVKPSSHIVLGILSTFCCGCFPLGLVSLIFAIITINHNGAGDYAAAARSSRLAALWGWIAIVLGLINCIAWTIWSIFWGGVAEWRFNFH